MTLPFSTHLNGKPTQFVEKIVLSLLSIGHISICRASELLDTPMTEIKNSKLHPKHHTIRADLKDNWRPDRLIHFVINNRTTNRKQFAPIAQCCWVQIIKITHYVDFIAVTVDNKNLGVDEIAKLAVNDGFESVADFFSYFNKDFTGKIIHWTNLKY